MLNQASRERSAGSTLGTPGSLALGSLLSPGGRSGSLPTCTPGELGQSNPSPALPPPLAFSFPQPCMPELPRPAVTQGRQMGRWLTPFSAGIPPKGKKGWEALAALLFGSQVQPVKVR